MPTIEVQEEIIKTLRGSGGALTMSELVQRLRHISQAPTSIRAAVLPLISHRQVELTPERKLQLPNKLAS